MVVLQVAQLQEKERGAGDWQHYQSPSEVLKAVAQRKAPGPPGPPGPHRASLPGPPRPPSSSGVDLLHDEHFVQLLLSCAA